jgi:hypothetical protein
MVRSPFPIFDVICGNFCPTIALDCVLMVCTAPVNDVPNLPSSVDNVDVILSGGCGPCEPEPFEPPPPPLIPPPELPRPDCEDPALPPPFLLQQQQQQQHKEQSLQPQGGGVDVPELTSVQQQP